MANLKTRFLGICPVCFNEFKLKQTKEGPVLVHHAFQRPGNGHIVGDCFGVKHLSYNQSSQGCVEYQAAVESQLERERQKLQDIDSGSAKEAWVKRRVSFGHNELVKVMAEDPKFNEALRTFRMMVTAAIRDCEREITRMKAAIDGWTLKPVRTTEEAAAVIDAQKDVRKAERDAKRAAALAKATERKAIVEAREADRQVLIAKYQDLFIRGAKCVENRNSKRVFAVQTWVEMYKHMDKRSYLHFYPTELKCDDALIDLGLAEAVGTRTMYADRRGLL